MASNIRELSLSYLQRPACSVHSEVFRRRLLSAPRLLLLRDITVPAIGSEIGIMVFDQPSLFSVLLHLLQTIQFWSIGRRLSKLRLRLVMTSRISFMQ
jgi:hypothetical protein